MTGATVVAARPSRVLAALGRVGDFVARHVVFALGTIVAQNVQIQDLQEPLDGLDREVEKLRTRIAALTVQLCPTVDSCVGGKTASATVASPPFSGGGLGLQYSWSTATAPSYITDRFKACVTGPLDTGCSAID